MKIEELKDLLKEKGFQEEEQDTGWKFTKKQGHVELLCYIEPQIEVQFITFFRWQESGWNENGVKGIYNISIDKLRAEKEPLSILFKRTLVNMPEQIGNKADAHMEVKKVIDEIFG